MSLHFQEKTDIGCFSTESNNIFLTLVVKCTVLSFITVYVNINYTL